MNPRDFCFWLEGYFDISGAIVGGPTKKLPALPNAAQIETIRRRLAIVIEKWCGGDDEDTSST